MKNQKDIDKVIDRIESEMVAMWSTGEAAEVLVNDPDFIQMVLVAVYHEKHRFQAMGLQVGEA
tara:strand:+ start:1272 stop:1460 length:189 start_codon:yes stop_codon:yes gene_type:complete